MKALSHGCPKLYSRTKRWRGTRLTARPFRESLVQENLTFYRSFWGLKSLAPQLPVIRNLEGNQIMAIEKMSGLEIMRAMVAGHIPPASIAQTIPMKGVLAEEGKVQFEAIADERHLNPLGGVHGGFAATAMDSVTGCAVHTMLEAGVGYGTVDLNIKMLKAVPLNTKLIAEGNVVYISKSLGVSEGTLKDDKGILYAHATATCMIIRR